MAEKISDHPENTYVFSGAANQNELRTEGCTCVDEFAKAAKQVNTDIFPGEPCSESARKASQYSP